MILQSFTEFTVSVESLKFLMPMLAFGVHCFTTLQRLYEMVVSLVHEITEAGIFESNKLWVE